MRAELSSLQGNIVIDVIKGKKARTYMFGTRYVDFKEVLAKYKELTEQFNNVD